MIQLPSSYFNVKEDEEIILNHPLPTKPYISNHFFTHKSKELPKGPNAKCHSNKIESASTQGSLTSIILEASKGDAVLDYPPNEEFGYMYPDFDIEKVLKADIMLFNYLKSDILSISKYPCTQMVMLPQEKPNLAMEINEVLIHIVKISEHPTLPVLRILSEGVDVPPFVIRPQAIKFLEVLRLHYNIVLFTSLDIEVAKAVLRIIDKENEIFLKVLYKEDCIKLAEGVYVKDLRVFYECAHVMMLDTSIIGFANQISNGILVKAFDGSESDVSLLKLMSFLMDIKDYSDYRVELEKRLGLRYQVGV